MSCIPLIGIFGKFSKDFKDLIALSLYGENLGINQENKDFFFIGLPEEKYFINECINGEGDLNKLIDPNFGVSSINTLTETINYINQFIEYMNETNSIIKEIYNIALSYEKSPISVDLLDLYTFDKYNGIDFINELNIYTSLDYNQTCNQSSDDIWSTIKSDFKNYKYYPKSEAPPPSSENHVILYIYEWTSEEASQRYMNITCKDISKIGEITSKSVLIKGLFEKIMIIIDGVIDTNKILIQYSNLYMDYYKELHNFLKEGISNLNNDIFYNLLNTLSQFNQAQKKTIKNNFYSFMKCDFIRNDLYQIYYQLEKKTSVNFTNLFIILYLLSWIQCGFLFIILFYFFHKYKDIIIKINKLKQQSSSSIKSITETNTNEIMKIISSKEVYNGDGLIDSALNMDINKFLVSRLNKKIKSLENKININKNNYQTDNDLSNKGISDNYFVNERNIKNNFPYINNLVNHNNSFSIINIKKHNKKEDKDNKINNLTCNKNIGVIKNNNDNSNDKNLKEASPVKSKIENQEIIYIKRKKK